MEKILEIKNLNYSCKGNNILKNINLIVKENDFLGIIGANGAGKTTLIKLILGEIKQNTGEIDFYGITKDKIGYLPQFNLIDLSFPISVYEIALSGLINKHKIGVNFKHFDHEITIKTLKKMEIHHIKNKLIGEISKGELQRVFLARAVVNSPKLLILDEPNTFLDKEFTKNFYEILNKLNESMTIILVSHDLGMVSNYVKTIACIDKTLHYHAHSQITEDILKHYDYKIDIVAHKHIPHRVLKNHENGEDK